MAEISASMVKELRTLTGAGVMACKNALVETDGDMDAAVEVLRKKGEATAVKKSGRIAAEGTSYAVVKGETKAVVLEVNSETDFVAKNEKFKTFVANVADQIIDSDAKDVDELLGETWKLDSSKTVKDELVSQIAVIGENMNIRRFAKIEAEDGIVASYIHMGGKIATLVYAQTDVVNDAVKTALYNVAMQVTALNPKFITDEDVDKDYIDHEKEILLAQIQNDPKESQKPEKVIEGMIMGRIKKELKEVVLYDQAYFQAADGKQTVAQYIAEVAKAEGANIKVKKFVRFETGEGLEKKEEDFAAEVAKQMQ